MFVNLDGVYGLERTEERSLKTICGLGERCAELRRRLRKGWGLRAQEGWEGRMGARICGLGEGPGGRLGTQSPHLPLGSDTHHHVTAT